MHCHIVWRYRNIYHINDYSPWSCYKLGTILVNERSLKLFQSKWSDGGDIHTYRYVKKVPLISNDNWVKVTKVLYVSDVRSPWPTKQLTNFARNGFLQKKDNNFMHRQRSLKKWDLCLSGHRYGTDVLWLKCRISFCLLEHTENVINNINKYRLIAIWLSSMTTLG